MCLKDRKYFIILFLFSMLLFTCKNERLEKKYEVKIDSGCSFQLTLPEESIQKISVDTNDSLSNGDITHSFKLDNDSSELKIIFNRIDFWDTEVKNYTDLKESLVGLKMGEYIFSEVLSSTFMKIDTLRFLKVKYGILLLGTETVYSTMQNGKIISFEFISHKYESGYFVQSETEIMSGISLLCK